MSNWRDLITPEAKARAQAILDDWRENPVQGPDPEPVSPDDCTSPAHGREFGPCTDVGQCRCGMPVAALRPRGETYGFHADDCASEERHYGSCEPGGTGHPVGLVRGYWPGMDDDIAAARARHGTYAHEEEDWDL